MNVERERTYNLFVVVMCCWGCNEVFEKVDNEWVS